MNWYSYFILFTVIPLAWDHLLYLTIAEPVVKEGVGKAETLLARHNAESNEEAVKDLESWPGRSASPFPQTLEAEGFRVRGKVTSPCR